MSRLKKLCIILLTITALFLAYTLFQTHIQVAVFDTALNNHSGVWLDSKDGANRFQRKPNSKVEMLETKNTADVFDVATTKETNMSYVSTPRITEAVNAANTGPTAVILLTYMRSGSSLTGDILQQPDDAFYVFEPLRKTMLMNSTAKTIHFLNGTSLTYGKKDLHRIYEETLYGWLTCDLSRVYIESLLDFFLTLGKKFRRYDVCMSGYRKSFAWFLQRNVLHNNEHFIGCLNMLREICQKSKFRLVKTIRANMEVAKLIMNRIPKSKILHLVRDPRATIASQRKWSRCQEGVALCITEHCNNVRKDTATKQFIKSAEPNRLDQVLYEDLASNPIATSQKMYSFIGMNFTETIANYVYNITLGKDKSGCIICLLKWQLGKSLESSETHIAAWKNKLPGQYINQTQIICKDVIKYYGYEEYRAPPD